MRILGLIVARRQVKECLGQKGGAGWIYLRRPQKTCRRLQRNMPLPSAGVSGNLVEGLVSHGTRGEQQAGQIFGGSSAAPAARLPGTAQERYQS